MSEKDRGGFVGKWFKIWVTNLYRRPGTRNLRTYISAVDEEAAFQAARHVTV